MIERNAIRIEIFVDRPLLRRIRDLATEVGVDQYTILPTLGGGGEQGRWHDDQVTGGAGSKVIFLTYLRNDVAKKFLETLQPLTREYGLFIASSNSEVAFEE